MAPLKPDDPDHVPSIHASRVFELRDLIEQPLSPSAYFQDFETVLGDRHARSIWLAREHEFQRLDAVSWGALKSEARPYLKLHDPNGRGWQQLIDVLNQARAHNYLTDLGCSGVRFVPRGGKETSDLEGTLDMRRVLCEVKTVNISEDEANRRNTGQGGEISNLLNEQFLNKLKSTLGKTKSQMEAYDIGGNARRIAFLIINFDDSFAEYKADYYRQIDQHLASDTFESIDIVFDNQNTALHADVSMQSALVVNEESWPDIESKYSASKTSGIDESSGWPLYHVAAGTAGRPSVIGDRDVQAAASDGKLPPTSRVPEGRFRVGSTR